jgi:hypothetical protein
MADQPPDPLMRRIARTNRTAAFLAALVLGLAGFFLPGFWGGLVLFGVIAALAFILRQTWAVTPPPLRVVRLLIIAVLVIVAAAKIS